MDAKSYRYQDERGELPSPWGGRWWGILLFVLGLFLFLSLYSFNVREIGWSALNSLAIEHPSEITTNYLGVVGLYIAGLLFWLLGLGAWVLVFFLYWMGLYRIVRNGELPNRILYWAIVGILTSCVFFAAQTSFWNDWREYNELRSVGGIIGYLLCTISLQKFLSSGWIILISGFLYMVSLIYVSGTRPVSFLKGIVKEWGAWKEYKRRKNQARREKVGKELEQSLQNPVVFEDRFGKPKNVDAADTSEQKQNRFKALKKEFPSTRKRTGDDLSDLDSQSELDLKYMPKIVDASNTRPTVIPEENTNINQNTGDHERVYELPSLDILKAREEPTEQNELEKEELYATQQTIINTLKLFGVEVTAGNITKGPTITRYEIYPASGLRVSRITNLEQDLARATKAVSINILAPIPGKDTVGIEIVNKKKVPVVLRDLLMDAEFRAPGKRIPLALGKDVYGKTVIGDLAAMPHLLVAGTTGSGKSVCINSIITSILYKFSPDDLKFLLVDPKVVEMQPYSKLPHLLVPVVTDPKKVINALRYCVNEMERRYRCFAKVGVRNFEAFNNRPREEEKVDIQRKEPECEEIDEELVESIAADFESQGEDPESVWDDAEYEEPEEALPEKFPYIVIIIDELADLMQTAPADMEGYIGRLTQKARAAGIHLIVATQTPRRDVVTGIIKANIPCRIAFQVSSQLDSRIILDQSGAEKLVGKGDLLYLPPGSGKLDRAQGAFISDDEVECLVAHCAAQVEQQFLPDIQESIESGGGSDGVEDDVSDADEETYKTCMEIVLIERKASTSLLQRRLRIGYGRAARMMDLLERRGVIGPSEGPNKPREVLISE